MARRRRHDHDAGGEVTELRPARGQALAWSLIGVAAIGLALWLVVDTDGHALAVALLLACLIATAPWAAQLVAPRAFAWRLDREGLLVRRMHRRLIVSWEEVRFARVVGVGGDPALELHLRAAGGDDTTPARAGRRSARGRPGGTGETDDVHTLRLPVGADVAALHRALATRLGPLSEGTPPEGHPGRGLSTSAGE